MSEAIISVGGEPDNASKLDYDAGDSVSLEDTGGGSPSSRLWTIRRWPAPLAVAPSFSPNATAASVSFTASTDGGYIVNLQRTDADIVTSADVFIGARDASGLILPPAGLSGTLVRPDGETPASQEEGWRGHSRCNTDFLLEAYLRYAKGNAVGDPELVGLAGVVTTDATGGFVRKGVFRLDPARFAGKTEFRIKALLETTNASNAAQLRMMIVGGAQVGSTLSVTALTPTYAQSALIAIPGSLTTYALELSMGAGASPDFVTCWRAWLEMF